MEMNSIICYLVNLVLSPIFIYSCEVMALFLYRKMILKSCIFSCTILLAVGIALLLKTSFFKEKSVYTRLKTRKKRSLYSVQDIQVLRSSIIGNLLNETSGIRLTFILRFKNDEIINFQVNDEVNRRYIVNDVITIPNSEDKSNDLITTEETFRNINIKYCNFEIVVNRNPFEMTVFKNKNMIFSMNSQKRLLMETKEPHVAFVADFFFAEATVAYGLPQRAEHISLRTTKSKPYRLYNTDRCGYSSSNHLESLYGSVPVLYSHGYKKTVGLLWLNSSETFVDLEYENTGLSATFYSESGVLDFFVLSGPTLQDCVRQNAQLTGVVPLPPLFALGYHQCRFSYMTQEEVEQVSNKFDENKFALDSIWMDIDCTNDKKYFTWNPKTYPHPEKLLQFLESKKRKGVVIIDPHIKVDENYFVYKECKEKEFLIKNPNRSIYTAKCWPGKSAWIDFFNPKAREYYTNLHKNFAKARNLHIWNDMNEPAVFETKENSMSKNALHYGEWKHRDVHNLYGFYHSMATYEALLKRSNLRPFILTRSHFAGSQRFSAIWTGDNVAEWSHLQISLPMCLTASLAGFSLCGADIGGFLKHPSDELLQRWYQLGAWLPFFRNHSNEDVPRREPYLYSTEIQQRIRISIQQRYKHLLYWYTLFWNHSVTSEPVIRPLVYHYPNDRNVFDLENQFLVGRDILICPIINPEQTHISVYLPGGKTEIWYYINNGIINIYRGDGYVNLAINLESIPVFYRGGSIIPMVKNSVESSASIQNHPLSLHVFLNTNESAVGMLYTDDGETFDYLKNVYSFVKFHYENDAISNCQTNENCTYSTPNILNSIKVYGQVDNIKNVTLTTKKSKNIHLKIAADNLPHLIKVDNIKIDVKENFCIKFEK